MNFLLGISKKYHVGYLIPYGVQTMKKNFIEIGISVCSFDT